ncbi:energy transducer TonB [Terracidiphilus sp.]|uniref:energy transducer TonB n=1 Tax=Terracidiphilus sp. TaxID=1964191 RepID=UPI003C2033CE
MIYTARLLQATLLLLLAAALLPFAAAQETPQTPAGMPQSTQSAAPASDQSTPNQQPSQPAPGLKAPADRDRLNALAHKLLTAALKKNALDGDGLKPWHIKIEYSLVSTYKQWDRRLSAGGGRMMRGDGTLTASGGGSADMLNGTVEEWHAGHYQWSRVYASRADTWNGTLWRVSHIEHYELRPKNVDFAADLLNGSVTQPVVDPMYQAALAPPEAMLAISRVSPGDGQSFNCISVTNPNTPGPNGAAAWNMPTMCFDSELRLRLVSSADTAIQFMDFQPYQDRSVARTVRVLVHGQLNSEMKVTLLEDFDPATNGAFLKPTTKAVLQPYAIEEGDPPLVSVYEQGTTIPLLGDGTPFRGTVSVSAIIRKDGSVKALTPATGPLQPVLDAVSIAVSKWKYKPYLIDGQPVEVRVNISYLIDGKPFVPSYQRAGQAPGSHTP